MASCKSVNVDGTVVEDDEDEDDDGMIYSLAIYPLPCKKRNNPNASFSPNSSDT